MNIKKKQEGSTLFVKISGRIDTATSPEVDSYINENLDGVNEVILDFEEVKAICKWRDRHELVHNREELEQLGITDSTQIEKLLHYVEF